MEQLTIFYTYQLRGDLQLLPRLYTFLQTLKQKHNASQALILDLGESCVDTVWHCEVTKGRSMLVVLDGMGYHAANVTGFIGDSQRDRLKSGISMGQVTERHGWRYFVPPVRDEDIVIAGRATPALKLCIIAAPAEANMLDNRMLHLKAVAKAEVGVVSVDLQALSIVEEAVYSMPKGIKPDATIAASVELVEEEARFIQKS